MDYDDDGWLDLLVTNDTQPNKLYRNNHNGTFSDVAVQAGVAYSDAGATRAGMGVDNGDYDNSGHPGLVIGNFTNEGMALYRTDGSGLYTSASEATGIDRWSLQSLTFSTFFFDYDLDGLLDVLAVNGHVADDISVTQPHLKYAEPALIFRNRGKGQFENMSTQLGPALQQPMVGRGAAYGDFDNDGDLDLVITEANGPARLLRNENGNQNDMLRVKLIGTRSNRDGIGAKLTLQVDKNLRLLRMVKTGSGYLSQSELPVTFGLGKPDPARKMRLTIAWPSGHKDTVENLTPNQAITVQEGKGIVAAHPIAFQKCKDLQSPEQRFRRAISSLRTVIPGCHANRSKPKRRDLQFLILSSQSECQARPSPLSSRQAKPSGWTAVSLSSNRSIQGSLLSLCHPDSEAEGSAVLSTIHHRSPGRLVKP